MPLVILEKMVLTDGMTILRQEARHDNDDGSRQQGIFYKVLPSLVLPEVTANNFAVYGA